MGSNDSYRSYERNNEHYTRTDTSEETKRSERAARVKSARATVAEKKSLPKRDEQAYYDASLAKNIITRPAPGVKRVHIVLVDNSGSNRAIAEHLRESSGYLASCLKAIDPNSQIATIYFSDHGDNRGLRQDVDFVSPNEQGDKILLASIKKIDPANGFDSPEAIECMLAQACDIDFGDATERYLYLVTDVVGHGMGMSGDDLCPDQTDWRQSLKRVSQTYTAFQVVGCGNDSATGLLQRQFLSTARVDYDLVDLSAIPNSRHRMAITGNALLFLIARNNGFQAVELFLSFLYEKWLTEPIFGGDTDLKAQEAIKRFTKYLEVPQEKVDQLLEKIFV